ncbi:MAG: hypothetical protein AAGE85_13915 [Pseudomonadota bacterium]
MDDLTPESMSPGATKRPDALHSANQVSVAAFLGGAFAGGWLMSRNFAAVDDQAQRKKSMAGGLLLSAVFAFAAMWLPTGFPNSTIPAVTVATFTAWYHFRLKSVFAAHLEDGGAKASWWKTIGLSLLALIPTFIIFLLVIFLVPVLPANHIKDGANVIYYEGDATRQDAASLAGFFRETGVFDDDEAWELTLIFPNDEPQLAVIALTFPEDIEGTPTHDYVKALATLLDEEKYPGKEVEIRAQNAFGLTRLVIRNE